MLTSFLPCNVSLPLVGRNRAEDDVHLFQGTALCLRNESNMNQEAGKRA